MNPSSSSSSMAPVLADYHKKAANSRSKILKNEEERIQLEQKLRSLSSIDSRLKQRQQIEHIQSYFTKLNEESQRAKQRNLNLLNDLTQAEHNLAQLRIDTEQLMRLKSDYLQYLESSYSNRQKNVSTGAYTSVNNTIDDYDRLRQQQNDGNFRHIPTTTHQSDNIDSSLLYKRYEDQLKTGLDRTNLSITNPEIKNQQQDDQSISDTTSNTFSRSKHSGSLRMELHRTGLYFLLDYIERELIDTIDKKKFYRHDPPTITQKRTILDIANEQKRNALEDLDPTTTSMVILDQLSSTIRRTTINKCLLTEDILSSNIKDLDKDIITKILPEQDRSLWTRLIDHFIRLLKLHIMSSQTLTNKFAPLLLPNNSFYLYDKAKSLLKHILEKIVGIQHSSSDDDISTNKKQPIQHIIKTNTTSSSSSWLDKLKSGGIMDDDDDISSSSSSSITAKSKKNLKSISSTSTTPRINVNRDDSDLEFYS
ncbi:unnamed protein product [Rotaria sp. Silwood1]|nr:unnamed protein product [Rotaria sp. Silwood1]CAF3585108.1 unnamed protein product [Rotaria sp. Silwood1]CAF3706894.1 unnamed protein product [Rotaria sp. Silwood1]CAF3728337.1 unnamed protein product [Rotaria sp. Silwood1]CAF4626101.1 unnamed protein product [Rotaria sp. Silwood1]